MPGYREEEGVSPASTTETYVALRLQLDSWRWAGVPFYLRTGKRLPKRTTEIAIQFRRPPLHIFKRISPTAIASNLLVVNVQPDEGISVRFEAKLPGSRMQLAPVMMNFRYGSAFGTPVPEAYETLLLDAMLGDPTLFARHDFVEASWAPDHADPRGVAARGRDEHSDLRGRRVGSARGGRDDGGRQPPLEDAVTPAQAKMAKACCRADATCRSPRLKSRSRASCATAARKRGPARALTATVIVVGKPDGWSPPPTRSSSSARPAACARSSSPRESTRRPSRA